MCPVAMYILMFCKIVDRIHNPDAQFSGIIVYNILLFSNVKIKYIVHCN